MSESFPILYRPRPWNETKGHVILWHGCTGADALAIKRFGVDPSRGRPNTDFGQGFYTTTLERQAGYWAWKRYYSLASDRRTSAGGPVVLRFRVPRPRPRLTSLETLHFTRGDHNSGDYWSLVHHCRQSESGRVENHKCTPDVDPDSKNWYDVVSGPVAAFWDQCVAMPDSDQTSFHTRSAAQILEDLVASDNNDEFRVVPVK